MPENLNPIQVAHVNEVVRPFLERFILADDVLATFVAEYDALQNGPNALPTTGEILNDAPGGVTNREDAPTLTGAQIALLRTRVGQMRAVMDAEERKILIDKMVRDLATIRGG